jgi:formate/nitrite transporter FocA (FNT family)
MTRQDEHVAREHTHATEPDWKREEEPDKRPRDEQEQEQQHKKEEEQAEERATISASVVYQAILKEGRSELERSSSALAWSGLAAGLSRGFSLVSEGLLRHALPDAPWRPLIVKLGYSVGFLIVILGRQQLFTENTLTPILPLMRDLCAKTFGNVARLWAIVLLMNLIGAAIFAIVIARTPVFEAPARAAFLDIGKEALSPAWGTILLRGIFAGWMIALMVWLLPVAEVARFWVIIVITYVVGLGHFSHIIAGSVEVFYVAASGQTSVWYAIGHYVIPTLIGNCIGGVSLVAALNHAQVVAGDDAAHMDA